MNCRGIGRASRAANSWLLKQKHSIFLKYLFAVTGAMLGTAWPTLSAGARFFAVNVAKYSFPGWTSMLSTSASNSHGAYSFTVVMNSTRTVRLRSGASTAATAVELARPPKPVISQNTS